MSVQKINGRKCGTFLYVETDDPVFTYKLVKQKYLVCSKKLCGATAKVIDVNIRNLDGSYGKNFRRKGEHNHLAEANLSDVLRIKNAIKEEVKNNPSKPLQDCFNDVIAR